MKKILIYLVLAIWVFMAQSQNFFNYQWKFRTGDDKNWAIPDYDDADWGTIIPGKLWENQGYANYDGFAWYRQALVIPAGFKEKARESGGLIIYLGAIDDADQTFFNGQFIGKTGEMPPDYRGAVSAQRAYEVPFELIRWDAPNVLAVRVYDAGGGGGIYGDKIGCFVKGREKQLEVKPGFERENRLFLGGEKIQIPLLFVNNLDSKLVGNAMVTVVSDFGERIFYREYAIEIMPESSAPISLEPGKLSPGFYNVSVVFAGDADNKIFDFSFGIDPENILSPTDKENDFAAFWQKARADLNKVEPEFKMIRKDSLCTELHEVFLVEMKSLEDVLIRGWYSRPTKEGVYPAILRLQGYSTVAAPSYLYTEPDMVSFALNIRGHGNSRDDVNPGFPGYLLHGIQDKESYIYRGAYMDGVRAIDFLMTQDCVDPNRIGVEGASQGGALSVAVAALDARVSLCVTAVPFLSDFRDYFAIAAWPGGEFFNYLLQNPQFAKEEMFRVLSYFDIKNLATQVNVPVLMAIGLRDMICPPHINFAAYNQISSPKEYVIYPMAGHSLPSAYNPMRIAWIRKQFGME